MIEYNPVEHRIQKHILEFLTLHSEARFSEMRPPKTDTNLYSYHLKLLIKQEMIKKTEQMYTLDIKGAVYVDRISTATGNLRPQPKIITMLVLQNGDGQVLMYRKKRQPFISQWTLPFGKVHNDDTSVYDAARRELLEKLDGLSVQDLKHAGESYLHIKHGEDIAISTLVHVFYGTTNDTIQSERLQWLEPLQVAMNPEANAPGVTEIMQFALISKQFFFEEVSAAWN